ncbi:MAG: toll/interleukin-1 receptor domain-containing protein [Clostridia bacterium]|nr:toll/interleukin-1 receptor domain-containing protein [Clostridia bacterium]
MSNQVFISYRRDGGEVMAQLIYDRLVSKGYNVFYDIESLKSGPFNTKIYQKIEESVDFVLILPAHALDRCVYDEDWVRNEIRHAIQKGKNIVPLIMRGFVFPSNLPSDIANVRNYNGVSFENMEYLDAKIDRLASMLASVPGSITNTPRPSTQQQQKRGVTISYLRTIPTADKGNLWPKTEYTDVINRNEAEAVCFHLGVKGISTSATSVNSGLRIYNSSNETVLDKTMKIAWQSNYDRLSRSWNLKKSDGTFAAAPGRYRAELWVDDSETVTCNFEITSGTTAKSQQSQGVSVSRIRMIGARDDSTSWPVGYYTDVINNLEFPVVYFQIDVKGVPKGDSSINSVLQIYNSYNTKIFDSARQIAWQDNYDRLSRGWRICGNGINPVAVGKYRAVMTVNGSAPISKDFTIISNRSLLGQHTVSIPYVKSIVTPDKDNLWPQGNYSSVIDMNVANAMCFHVGVNGVPTGKASVTLGIMIFNSSGERVFYNQTIIAWKNNYDRISKSWSLKNADGSFAVSPGRYRAEIWVDDSRTAEYHFELTGGYSKGYSNW